MDGAFSVDSSADVNLVFTRVVNHYVTVVGTSAPPDQKVGES
jgi:hypothetical protein